MPVDLEAYVTPAKFFKWKEVLLLPSWGVYHIPSDQEYQNIISLITKIDVLHKHFGKGINVHCCIRPSKANCPGSKYNGMDYNSHVGGVSASSHIPGLAIDFDVTGMTVDAVMVEAAKHLNDWELSWEKNGSAVGRNWCHAQNKKVGGIWKIYNP